MLGMNRVKIVVRSPEGKQVRYEEMPKGIEGVDVTKYLGRKVQNAMRPGAHEVSASYMGEEIRIKCGN